MLIIAVWGSTNEHVLISNKCQFTPVFVLTTVSVQARPMRDRAGVAVFFLHNFLIYKKNTAFVVFDVWGHKVQKVGHI